MVRKYVRLVCDIQCYLFSLNCCIYLHSIYHRAGLVPTGDGAHPTRYHDELTEMLQKGSKKTGLVKCTPSNAMELLQLYDCDNVDPNNPPKCLFNLYVERTMLFCGMDVYSRVFQGIYELANNETRQARIHDGSYYNFTGVNVNMNINISF